MAAPMMTASQVHTVGTHACVRDIEVLGKKMVYEESHSWTNVPDSFVKHLDDELEKFNKHLEKEIAKKPVDSQMISAKFDLTVDGKTKSVSHTMCFKVWHDGLVRWLEIYKSMVELNDQVKSKGTTP